MRAPGFDFYAPQDRDDLTMLLPLCSMGERSYRNGFLQLDSNACFGAGQVAGQALWAASQSAKGWSVSAVQLSMLRAPRFDEWLEYAVESTGETPRTLTRHVYGVEGLETVSSMHVRFEKPDAFAFPRCQSGVVASFDECRMTQRKGTTAIPFVEVHQADRAGAGDGRHSIWCRLKHAVPREGIWRASALAYMAASSVPAAMRTRAAVNAYPAWHFDSQDFSMFFHSASFDANDWLLFDTDMLAQAEKQYTLGTRIYARSGLHLATSVHTCIERNEFQIF